MISAIAARKARQGLEQNDASTTAAVSPSPPRSPPVTSNPSPIKRKSKPSTSSPAPKKVKAKHASTTPKNQRYFDIPNQQQDGMIIDTDLSDGSLSQSDVEDPPDLPATSRAYSPSQPILDSSDEESGAEEPGVTITSRLNGKTPSPLTTLSTFTPTLDRNTFHLNPNELTTLHLEHPTIAGTLLRIPYGQTLTLLGTYILTIISGSITIAGTHLIPHLHQDLHTSHRVFAPKSAPLPSILAHKGGGSTSHLPSRVTLSNDENCTVIVIQELKTGVQGLGKICKIFDTVFSPSPSLHSDDSLGLQGVQVVIRQTKEEVQTFVTPESWETTLRSLVVKNEELKPRICLVKGPKKSGKSSFAKTLLNTLLSRYQRVAFLECDLGQSEFTPGGMVSLNVITKPILGPAFTHPSIPTQAHYVGATTPRSAPSHYLAAIQSLVQVYRLDVANPLIEMGEEEEDEEGEGRDERVEDVIPLVVNTMGWTKGLGADLAVKIEEMVQPTDVFEIEDLEPQWNGVPVGAFLPREDAGDSLFSRERGRLHLLEPAPSSVLSTNYTPTDHRTLSVLSYFHSIFAPTPTTDPFPEVFSTSWNTSLPLCAKPPYKVDWTIAFDEIVLTGAGAEDVVPSEILRVLNGAIVALVSCEPGTLESDLLQPIPYTQGSYAPSPSTSKCIGLALIRSISTTPGSTTMHILTPIPPHLLSTCRVIVKGEMELPVWGMLDFRQEDGVGGIEEGKVPFLQWGKMGGVGGERRRVRRNLMRRGQM